MLVATNKGHRWFFVFDFKKYGRATISDEELEGLQTIAADLPRAPENEKAEFDSLSPELNASDALPRSQISGLRRGSAQCAALIAPYG
jgi:hypothetical protein